MTKISPEVFEAIVTSLTRSPKFSTACEVVGIAEKTLYRWLAKSQAGDPSFCFEYLEEGTVTPLHVAVKQAQQIYAQGLVADAEHVARYGEYRVTHHRGQPCYQISKEFLSWTDEELSALGLDRYKRDENGELIPVLEWHPPSAQLRLAALAARAPKLYGAKVEHNINQKVSLGVHVVPNRPMLPPLPVEVLPAPAVPTVEAEDIDFLELPKSEPATEAAPALAPEEGRAGPNPDVKAYSPLRASLEALAAARASQPASVATQGAAPQRPPVPIHRNYSGSAERDGIGPGIVRPGGVKIA